jgi:hypothetical protein
MVFKQFPVMSLFIAHNDTLKNHPMSKHDLTKTQS